MLLHLQWCIMTSRPFSEWDKFKQPVFLQNNPSWLFGYLQDMYIWGINQMGLKSGFTVKRQTHLALQLIPPSSWGQGKTKQNKTKLFALNLKKNEVYC